MDVDVYYGGQRGGRMPYTALPAFRLFCRQNGFQLKWDPKNKRVDLDSGLKGKVCVLYAGIASSEQAYEKDIVEKVQRFVSEYGMEVVLGYKNDRAVNQSDVAIRISVKEMRALEKPRVVLFQTEDRRELVKSLQSELKQSGMTCLLKGTKGTKPVGSIVHLQLQIPQFAEIYKRKTYGEKVAFYLASGILNYFQEDLNIQPLAYLPPNLLKVFFDSVMLGQSHLTEFVSESAEVKKQEQEEDAEEAVQNKAELDELEDVDLVESDELEELGEEHLVLTIHDGLESESDQFAEAEGLAEPEESVEPEVPETPEVTETSEVSPEPDVPQTVHAPIQVEKRMDAEVFFDYTLIHSDSPDRPFLMIGTLQVKNTGTEDLYNPIVCLRVTPADSIKMGGQILPPKLVETLAVQDSGGLKGWRYLDDDWFTQAQERGEYWIAPIQPILIAPKATESFQNFQISFLKLGSGQSVLVEGMVLCNNQEVNFSANNRIAISF